MGLGTGCEGPNPPVGTQTDLALICHSLHSGRSGLRGKRGFSSLQGDSHCVGTERIGQGPCIQSMLGLLGLSKGNKHSFCQHLKKYNFLPENIL